LAADIFLRWNEPRHLSVSCRLCGSDSGLDHFVTCEQQDAAFGPVQDYWFCNACAGFFAYPFVYPEYSEDYGFVDYIRYYCEIGAGVDSMIQPILDVVNCIPVRTMIDVGCGVPFTVDFANRFLGVQAEGVDPSRYAAQGSALLGAPVESALLGQGSRHDGKKFDLVYSSEVIEHVPDPRAFARVLADHVADQGVLVITTPNAEFIGPGTNRLDNLATLWPGIHHAIYSARGLEEQLRQLGFSNVVVRRQRERLIAFATRFPFTPATPGPSDRRLARAYIGGLIKNPEGDRSLISGNLFRQFRDAVNEGEMSLALQVDTELTAFCHDRYGVSLDEVDRFVDDARTLDPQATFAKWPYFIYVYLYYRAMLLLHTGKFADAERGFRLFLEMLETCNFSNALWWQEGAHLYPSAAFHAGFAALLDKRQDDGRAYFERIIDGSLARLPGLPGLSRHDPLLPIRALAQRGVCYLQTGQVLPAISDLTTALERVGKLPSEKALQAEIIQLLNVAIGARAA